MPRTLQEHLISKVEYARRNGITPKQLNALQGRIAKAYNRGKIDAAHMGRLQSVAARATVLREPKFTPPTRPGGGHERRQFDRTEEQHTWHSGNTTMSRDSGTTK